MSTDPTYTNPGNSSTNGTVLPTSLNRELIDRAQATVQKLLDKAQLKSRQFSPTRSQAGRTAATLTAPELAAMIDHTLLKADARTEDVTQICEEARTHSFATVCLNSSWISLAAKRLAGSKTVPIAVVGFPLGAASCEAKAFEARQAIENGAREIDTVLAIGALKSGDLEAVFKDILAVVEASAPYPVKVILETALLTLEEKILSCLIAKAAGAAFVKTSTGFSSSGATVEDIALMRQVVGPNIGVKASGGIRTTDDARRMIEAGANRIGASASVAIVTGLASAKTEASPRGSSEGIKGY